MFSSASFTGSIKVTMTEKYLKSLADGTYTLEIYADKEATHMVSGTFTIGAAAAGAGAQDLPSTGDSSSLALWIGLMALCAGAFAVRSRRTRAN